jgi:Fur family ferric uptake transcriptional regulator
MKNPADTHTATADAAIRATSARVTAPRVAVLATLLTFDHAASHLDVAAAIAAHHAIDRVTVYRVLDWLVTIGLAHRIAGDDRVWRYKASGQPRRAAPGHHMHAHFTCEQCGQTFCLDNIQPKLKIKLPAGFTSAEVDLKLRGQCAHCA